MHVARSLALLTLGAACAADAGTGAPDTPDAAVRVEVVDNGEPVAAIVVFHRPDGGVDAAVRTGPDGVAAHPLAAGGAITVAYPAELDAASLPQLLTHLDVPPGSALRVELPDRGPATFDPGPIVATLDVDLPPLDGADRVEIDLGCTGATIAPAGGAVDIPEACVAADGTVSVSAQAFSAPDLPARLATSVARRVDASAGSLAMPAWVTPDPTIDVTVTDLPPGATDVVALATMRANGLPYRPQLADIADVAGGTAEVTLSPGVYVELAETLDLEIAVLSGVGGSTSISLLERPPEPSASIDGRELLPAIAEVAVDLEAGVMSWSGEAAPGADMTAAAVSSEGRRWWIVAPPDTASPIAFPDLPAELDGHRPPVDGPFVDAGVVLVSASWIGGYERFLHHFGFGVFDDACVPVDSTARLSRAGLDFGPRLSQPRW